MSVSESRGAERVATTGKKPLSRSLVLSLQIGFFVVNMAAWEVLVGTGRADPFFYSQPSAIVMQMVKWIVTGFIWPHLATTLIEALLAFVIGTVFGVACGLALARVELLARVFDPYIRILNALPRVILGPIFILWFGLGIASKVALAVTLVFFIVFFNT